MFDRPTLLWFAALGASLFMTVLGFMNGWTALAVVSGLVALGILFLLMTRHGGLSGDVDRSVVDRIGERPATGEPPRVGPARVISVRPESEPVRVWTTVPRDESVSAPLPMRPRAAADSLPTDPFDTDADDAPFEPVTNDPYDDEDGDEMDEDEDEGDEEGDETDEDGDEDDEDGDDDEEGESELNEADDEWTDAVDEDVPVAEAPVEPDPMPVAAPRAIPPVPTTVSMTDRLTLPDPMTLPATTRRAALDGQVRPDEAPILPTDDPKAELNLILDRLVAGAREALGARTVALFWTQPGRNRAVLAAKVSDQPGFTVGEKLLLDGSMLAELAAGTPVLYTDLAPADVPKLLPYYPALGTAARSAVGVPIPFESSVTGILVADSSAPGAFDERSISLLDRFVAVVGLLLQSFSTKFDLLEEARVVGQLDRAADRLLEASDRSTDGPMAIAEALVQAAGELVEAQHWAVVAFDAPGGAWRVQRVVSRPETDYIAEGTAVPVAGSLVGQAIASLEPIVVDDLGGTDLLLPRFGAGESAPTAGGAFAAIPVATGERAYGALVLERRDGGRFTPRELTRLNPVVVTAALALERRELTLALAQQGTEDELTGASTERYLRERLATDLARAVEFSEHLSLLVIGIDGLDGHRRRYGRSLANELLVSLAELVGVNARSFDTVGRLGEEGIGLVRVNADGNEAYLWAERLREFVVGHPFAVGGDRSVPVTISLGIAGIRANRPDAEAMIDGAFQALNRAMEVGGNNVKVF